MRILSLTAGAATMYCGSCLRDNALAAALLSRGHDVVLTPVYTPTRTDERNVSQDHVFFGGISVFLEQHSSLFRHTPRVIDWLFDRPWMLNMAGRRGAQTPPSKIGAFFVCVMTVSPSASTHPNAMCAAPIAYDRKTISSSGSPARIVELRHCGSVIDEETTYFCT